MSEAILHIGLAQALFAAFILVTKRRVHIADRILIACLLTIALKFFILVMHRQHSEFFDLEFSIGLVPLTFGPFLYLYTTYLVEDRQHFRWVNMLHFLPFLILTFSYFAFFQGVITFEDSLYFENDGFLPLRVFLGLFMFGSVLIYTMLTFMKVNRFRKSSQKEFSFRSRKISLFWLNFISVLFCAIFVIYFIAGLVNAVSFQQVVNTTDLSHFGLTFLAFAVSYFGIQQPRLFRDNQTQDAPAIESEPTEKKESKPRFTEERANQLAEKLNEHMETEKPWLNPELTLGELSGQINLSKYELTDLLNHHIGKNFFTYVNDFRLKAVMQKLQSTEFDHLTIIAIAYDCGFNSKSTFNNLFKQHAGMTPSAYKKQVSQPAQAEA